VLLEALSAVIDPETAQAMGGCLADGAVALTPAALAAAAAAPDATRNAVKAALLAVADAGELAAEHTGRLRGVAAVY
jgi:hypothetical protein